MPFECVIEKNRMAVVTGSGRVTGSDIVAQLVRLASQPDWEPGLNTLWDLREVQEITTSRGDLETYQATVTGMREQLGNGRIAIVAHRHLVKQIALVFVHVSPVRERELKVHPSMSEALDWLESKGEAPPTPVS